MRSDRTSAPGRTSRPGRASRPSLPGEDPSPPLGETSAARRRDARIYSVASAVLLSALVFQLNYLSFRHYQRWDWTEHSVYTLSERSRVVLGELDTPVELWVLLSASEPGFSELRNLIGRYQAESDLLTVHYVDPDRDPGGHREVAQRFHLGAMIRGDAQLSDVAAVVVSGERHWEITRDDLIRQNFAALEDEGRVELNVEGERAITGALVELSTGRPTKVCVTRGHGELSVTGGSRSLEGFAAEMRRENLTLEEIDTRGEARVPAGCDAVAVIGPEVAFDAAEAALLRAYLRAGGNLLVALDPVPNADQSALVEMGLESMLRGLGVQVDRAVVIEPDPSRLPASGGHPLGPFAVVDWGDHPIIAPFAEGGLPLLVSEARSVRPAQDGSATVLLRTSERSYAESDLRSLAEAASALEPDALDVEGPVSVAVATRVEVLGEAPRDDEGADEEDSSHDVGGRLVVLGDATLFASEFIAQPEAVNRHFASAVVGWLTARAALIAIDGRTIDRQPITMSVDDVTNLFLRVVVLIPLAFVFLGFAVWWNRRQ